MSAPKPTDALLQSTLDRQYRNKNPYKTLWHLYDGLHPGFIMSMIMAVVRHSPVWLMVPFTGAMINLVADPTPAHIHQIKVLAVILALVIAQNIPSHTLYAWFISRTVRTMQLLLRSALVVRLQQLSMSFHDDFHAGRLHSKVLRDVEAVETLTKSLINTVLLGVITIVIAITYTAIAQPRMLIVYAVTVPLSLILMHFFRNRMKDRNKVFRQELESMSTHVSEMIEMIPVTRAHAAEQTEVEKLHLKLLNIRKAGQELDVTNEFFACSTWTTFQLFQLACLLIALYLRVINKINVGDIVIYQGFFGQIVGSVQQLMGVFPQISSGVESIRSMGEILESPDLEHNEGKRELAKVDGRITFENVGFTYPNTTRPAIDNLSLDVRPGECIAFVGESGSGKSTIMNLIIGFRRPTSGRILLDGQDMQSLNLRTYRRFLSVVSQQTVLFSGTVRENITYGLRDVSESALQNVLEMANVAEFVSKLPDGLNTQLGARGGKLSGGQRQRIAIARALLRDPRVIILDEATSALDVISEKLVQEAIERLIADRTTFIVAHRLSTIRNADRIIVMQDGRAIESGTNDELLEQNGAFSRLKMLQV